ncbi:hypothetical protein QTP88_004427 [Uroleucon formosanum]
MQQSCLNCILFVGINDLGVPEPYRRWRPDRALITYRTANSCDKKKIYNHNIVVKAIIIYQNLFTNNISINVWMKLNIKNIGILSVVISIHRYAIKHMSPHLDTEYGVLLFLIVSRLFQMQHAK